MSLDLDRRPVSAPDREVVLILEDDAAVRTALHRALVGAGFHVVGRADGREPGLVLLDPGLLDVDEPGFAALLADLVPADAVVVLTSRQPERARRGLLGRALRGLRRAR